MDLLSPPTTVRKTRKSTVEKRVARQLAAQQKNMMSISLQVAKEMNQMTFKRRMKKTFENKKAKNPNEIFTDNVSNYIEEEESKQSSLLVTPFSDKGNNDP